MPFNGTRFVVENERKPLPLTRHMFLNSAAKMWCVECQQLRVATDFYPLSKQIQLDCQHRRLAKLEDWQ